MIILGLGGILKDAGVRRSEGRRTAWRPSKNAKSRASVTAGELPEAAIASALQVASAHAADVDCVAVVRPFASGDPSCTLRSQFPQRAGR